MNRSRPADKPHFAIGRNDLLPLLQLDRLAGGYWEPAPIGAGPPPGERGFYRWLASVETAAAKPVDPDAALIAFDQGVTAPDYALQLQATD